MITRESHHDLQYFIGKLCTIMMPPMGLHLDKDTYPEWFTITVDKITPEVIWGTDPQRDTRAAYFFPILGIAEEQILDSNHPDYEKIKSEVAQRKMVQYPSSPMHFSTDQLEQSAANLKNKIKGDKQ